MKSINKAILIGTVGKDPEIKYTPSGTAVAKLSIATNDKYKDKSGSWQEKTEWHNIVFWAKLAEIAGEYIKKGSRIYVEGKIETRSWDDKQSGQKKYMTEIVGQELLMLDGKSGESKPKPASKPAPTVQEIDDSEIPF